MTLSEMRTALLLAICEDGQSILTSAQQTLFINQAMHHVANWITSFSTPTLMVTNYSLPALVNTGGTTRFVYGVTSAATYPVVARLLRAEVTSGSTSDSRMCEIVTYEKAQNETPHTYNSIPMAFTYNDGVGFVRPADALGVDIWYQPGLPDMSADANTPGQTGSAAIVYSAAVNGAGGTSGTYAVGNILTVVGGTPSAGYTAATLKVLTVSSGKVATVSVYSASSYSSLPGNPVSVTGGGGSGAVFDLTWGEFGTANIIPIRFHPLIVTYAALLALTAEAADTAAMERIYARQEQELVAALGIRRRTPERG